MDANTDLIARHELSAAGERVYAWRRIYTWSVSSTVLQDRELPATAWRFIAALSRPYLADLPAKRLAHELRITHRQLQRLATASGRYIGTTHGRRGATVYRLLDAARADQLVRIPEYIVHDGPIAPLVLGYIYTRGSSSGVAMCSHREIADAIGSRLRPVGDAVRSLVEQGRLGHAPRGGRTSSYWLTMSSGIERTLRDGVTLDDIRTPAIRVVPGGADPCDPCHPTPAIRVTHPCDPRHPSPYGSGSVLRIRSPGSSSSRPRPLDCRRRRSYRTVDLGSRSAGEGSPDYSE